VHAKVTPSLAGRARAWSVHKQAREALAIVLGACGRAEPPIEVLPVKGIVTARLWYAEPSERPIQDIDLRVRPGDLARVAELAKRLGWRLIDASRAYGTLNLDVAHTMVEFESTVGPPGLCTLEVGTMIARAQRDSGGVSAEHLVPELHDHALLLCVNAFKDKLADALPAAIEDLARLGADRAFMPPRLAELARESHASTLTALTVEWLLVNGGLSRASKNAWTEVLEDLSRSGAPRPLYARAHRALVSRRDATGGAPRWLRPIAVPTSRLAPDDARLRMRAIAALAAYAVEQARKRVEW
jgi:hypothetical protein